MKRMLITLTHTVRFFTFQKVFFLLLFIITSACIFKSSAISAQESSFDFLTKEERQWLSGHPNLRLGVGISFPPYQWVDQDNKGYLFKGVVSEYIKILEKRLNVKMEVVFGIPFQQALDLGKKNEIDLFPCLAATPEREEFLLFTNPYISYPSVIITREDGPVVGGLNDLNGRTISAVKDQVLFSKLTKDYSHHGLKILGTETAEQDLEAVSFGRADACLMDLGVASYLIHKLRITNLKVAAPTGLDRTELAMGVRKDWPILQTIIQKTLNTITIEEKDAINHRWIQLKYEPGVPLNRILHWSGVIGFGILLILAVQFLWNRSLQREIRARKIIEKELKTVLETIPSGLCILSDRIIMQCNPAMEVMFGFEPGTLVGKSVRSLYENDETFKEYGNLIYNEIKMKGRFDGEVAYMRQNGELFWARDIGVPIFPERSEMNTVFSVTDISKQIKDREKLTLQKEELEATLGRIKRLEGIISICMYCKKIRNEESWEQLEKYITENSDAFFSHGICPDCLEKES